ncbi:endonuclease III [Candidatus Marinamargulisbacteria bacterium SCGC AG-343-D04]|nr:endonuclease III [Candidatus Marinamargulisbacteria bacterium SCGC AG-343-D04]
MPKETISSKLDRSFNVYSILKKAYPNLTTFLEHKNHFELLIAVILSAQCTDERVNKTTPGLFKQFPTAKALGNGNLDDIKHCIKSINFFNNKSKNIKETALILDKKYNGTVPDTLNELIKLPGVGRKTANVILGQAFGKPGITVDTHVNRLSRRLGFTQKKEAVPVEMDLQKVWKEDIWSDFSTVLIYHGRQICTARKAKCDDCIIEHLCPKIIS